MVMMTNLDELIGRSSPGDPRLYEALMDGYYNFIYRLTATILNDPCEADDAAQETFIRAASHIDAYHAGTNIKSWLAKIAINICRDKLRRMKSGQHLQEMLKIFSWQAVQNSPTLEEMVIRNERVKTIQKLVDSLDEKHRLPILLRYVQEMTIAEIAQTLAINEGTVLSRLHYAHLKLRNRLAALNPEQQENVVEGLE
jgi:RNA polymerase sigma-70 factor, ECF subfamily